MTPTKPVKVILGAFPIGDKKVGPGLQHFDSKSEVDGLLDAFYERGYRELDTSILYQGSEVRLGRSNATSRFVVHTKVKSGEPGDHEAAKIQASIEQSLKDLQATSVETVFLHLPDRQTPFEEVAQTMDQAIKQGKFRKFGVSNYSAAEVKKFIDICEDKGYHKPAVYQGQYNPVVRGGEEELFPLLRKHNIAFFGYSPAAGGFFSHKPTTTARWNSDNVVGNVYSSMYSHESVRATVEKVQELGKSVLDGNYGDAIIFGVSKMEQLDKTLNALDEGPLPDDLADAITAIYATLEGNGPPYHM